MFEFTFEPSDRSGSLKLRKNSGLFKSLINDLLNQGCQKVRLRTQMKRKINPVKRPNGLNSDFLPLKYKKPNRDAF